MKTKEEFVEIGGVGMLRRRRSSSKHLQFIAFTFASFGILWSILVSHHDMTTFLSMALMALTLVTPQR